MKSLRKFLSVRSLLRPLAVVGGLMLANGALAATIMVPTDGDVNFVVLGFTSGYSVRVFDDAEAVAPGGGIAVAGGLVEFDDSVGYTATSGGIDLDLIDSLKFQIGMCDGGSCATELFVSATGINQYQILYDIDGVTVGLIAIDVSPSEVPLPAAAWLFGSALLGLGVIKRRKT